MSSMPTANTKKHDNSRKNNNLRNGEIRTWEDYLRVYTDSLRDPEKFWNGVAEDFVFWQKKWNQISDCDYSTGKVNWYLGGELNVSENCLDRHIRAGRGDHRAIVWVGNSVGEERTFTYTQLHSEVCKVAFALESSGISKGDRVVFYLPNIPELAIGVLACARIGAVHSVIFGGFSAHSIQSRVADCQAKMIITADGTWRGDKWVDLKGSVDSAIQLGCPSVEKIVVFARKNETAISTSSLHIDWKKWVEPFQNRGEFPAKPHSAQDPLFILYTSGSTGKPKGVLHAMGGYLTYVTYSFQTVFQPKEDDVYWCTADMGWITGHSYLLYGPLSTGMTTVMFEGVPTYPDPSRFWEVVERYQINILYTAPTAIRILAAAGNSWVEKYSKKSLRVLGTVGEPINPEAWRWYDQKVGEGRCPIVDTWWQTETGGILISPLAGISKTNAGSASFPLPGVMPEILDEEGKPQELAFDFKKDNQQEFKGVTRQGALVLKASWPGQMVGVWGEPDRFYKTYFTQFPGYYFSGDAAACDEHGFFWIKGRTDDVIKVSGHRLGTAEVESACILNPRVAESAAVGVPDLLTGEALFVFVVLKGDPGRSVSDLIQDHSVLEKELVQLIRKDVGAVASPKKILFIPGLPKTRSGKIMRRLLKKIALSEFENLGDTSTLADPGVVELIVKSLKK